MDWNAIQSLIKEMNQTDLTLVEVDAQGLRIRLERQQNVAYINGAVALPVIGESVLPTQTIHEKEQESVELPKQAEESQPELIVIVSPMVGTFYSAASPDKPPLVKVGDRVGKGQKLCIIEAMKLMNEIESEYDGEIVEILVANEAMVEYGQPLFRVR